MSTLAGWQNFYVIAGAAAGALIGLQFVVMTLITNLPRRNGDAQAGEAFATPTIVHFATVLGLAGVLTAPWDQRRRGGDRLGCGGLRRRRVRDARHSTDASARRVSACLRRL